MADISPLLTEPLIGNSTEVAGLNLPPAALGTFERVPPNGCEDCPKNLAGTADHPCIMYVRLAPTNIRIPLLALFGIQNDINANSRTYQTIIELMRFAAHGTDQGITGQNKTNTSTAVQYPVVSISGATVTLRYAIGTVNPKAIAYLVASDNPEYSGSPQPGMPAKLYTEHTLRLPAGGRIFFANCILKFHAGARVRKVTLPDDLGIGDTFTVELDTALESGGLAVYPFDNPDDPEAAIEFYIGEYAEQLTEPRDISTQQFKIAASKTFTAPHPGDHIFVLEANKKIHVPASVPSPYFAAYGLIGTVRTSISTEALAGLTMGFTGGMHVAQVDLSAVDLSSYDSLLFEYWVNSESMDATFIGCDTCDKYKIDYSGSYKSFSGPGYCSRAATASAIAEFHPECSLNKCSEYVRGEPTNPLSRTIWYDLLASLPWLQEQKAAGFPDTFFRRVGATSLKALCSELVVSHPPGGWHETRIWQGLGGWTQQAIVAGALVQIYGFELLWQAALAYGPAGENIPSRKSQLDPYDPSDLDIGTPGTGGWDQHVYEYDRIVNGAGYHQRCGHISFDLVIPDIRKGPAGFAFPGGRIYFEYRDASYAELPDATGAVYLTKIQFVALNKFRRLNNPVWTRDKGSFLIVSADADSGVYTVDLKNKLMEASSLSGPVEETSSQWLGSGNCVAHLPQHRFNNYKCDQSVRGPQDHLLKVGDAVIIPSVHPTMKFSVVSAEAATGAIQQAYPGTVEIKRQVPNVLYYVEIDTDEVISSVAVTRNAAATTLVAIEGDAPPYHLDRDQFWWHADVDTANDRQRVYFKFAAGNMTAVAADYEMAITIETDTDTHNASFDALNDGTFGAEFNSTLEWASTPEFTEVSLARFYYKLPTGRSDFFDLEEVAPKANLSLYADTEYSIDRIDDQHWTFTFSPNLMGGRIELHVVFDGSDFGGFGNDDDFFAAKVLTLHGTSCPTAQLNSEDFEDYGRRGDRVGILDSNDMIADWISDGGVLAGESFTAATNLVASEDIPTFARATANSADPDVPIAPENVTWFGASGLAFLTEGVLDGQCLYISGLKLAVRDLQLIEAEQNAPARVIEKMLDGGLSDNEDTIAVLAENYSAQMEFGDYTGAGTIVGTPTEELLGDLDMPDYGDVGCTPFGFTGGMYNATAVPFFACSINIKVRGWRRYKMDRLADAFNLSGGLLNVHFSSMPVETVVTGSGYVNTNPSQEAGDIALNHIPVDMEDGTWWHQTYDVTTTPSGELQTRLALVGVNFDGAGILYARALGASLPFAPGTDPVAVDVSDIIAVYRANASLFCGFAWLVLPNFIGDFMPAGTGLVDSLDAVKSACFSGFITSRFEGDIVPTGNYTCRAIRWENPMVTGLGKTSFSGLDPDIGGLMYSEVPEVLD